jgi:hypothetical protein
MRNPEKAAAMHLALSVHFENLQWTRVPLLGQIMGVLFGLFSSFGGYTLCDALSSYLHSSF